MVPIKILLVCATAHTALIFVQSLRCGDCTKISGSSLLDIQQRFWQETLQSKLSKRFS